MKLQNSICNCYLASLVQPKPHHNNVLDKLCFSNNEQIFQIIINARDKWNLSCTIFFSLNWMGWNCTLLHVKTCKQVMFFYYVHAVKIAWGEKKTWLFFQSWFSLLTFFPFFSIFLVTARKSLYISRAVRHFFGTEFEIWAGFEPEPNLLIAIKNFFLKSFLNFASSALKQCI